MRTKIKTPADARPDTFEARLFAQILEMLPGAEIWVELNNPKVYGHTLHVSQKDKAIEYSRILTHQELAEFLPLAESLLIYIILNGLASQVAARID